MFRIFPLFFSRYTTFALMLFFVLLILNGCGKNPRRVFFLTDHLNMTTNATDTGPAKHLLWESRMLHFGTALCNRLKDLPSNSEAALSETYYDATFTFIQMARYHRDPKWLDCADIALTVYRDNYVIPNEGKVPGYWNFSHGLTQHYLDTRNPQSQKAVFLLEKNAAFAAAQTPLEASKSSELSREVSYAIMTYLNAQRIGSAENPRLRLLVKQALGHLEQWFAESQPQKAVKPFMVGLTVQALIQYYEYRPDLHIISAIQSALTALWLHSWKENEKAFQYQLNKGDEGAAPDLNLLIAPGYMWMYLKTKDTLWLERADDIFGAGVELAHLAHGKQFNQNYFWSFNFMKWRRQVNEHTL
jgi:hypothetical protein